MHIAQHSSVKQKQFDQYSGNYPNFSSYKGSLAYLARSIGIGPLSPIGPNGNGNVASGSIQVQIGVNVNANGRELTDNFDILSQIGKCDRAQWLNQ